MHGARVGPVRRAAVLLRRASGGPAKAAQAGHERLAAGSRQTSKKAQPVAEPFSISLFIG